ncbi:MAG: 30S ribosomal protein S27ae [Candidatus Methanofastidiosia archaeon]
MAIYEIKDGKLTRKNKQCPRCGAGTFLADHGDRLSCGKCRFTQWKSNR